MYYCSVDENVSRVVSVVGPLMNITSRIERKRREGDAAVLSVLNVIAAVGSARPLDIAKSLGVHPSTVTRHIQTLEKLGQVKVEVDVGDGRACLASLTDAGREQLKALIQFGLSRFQSILKDWSPQELETFALLLAKMDRSMSESSSVEEASRNSRKGRKP
jgi:DNA-binding MarR family transcriptional regulator